MKSKCFSDKNGVEKIAIYTKWNIGKSNKWGTLFFSRIISENLENHTRTFSFVILSEMMIHGKRKHYQKYEMYDIMIENSFRENKENERNTNE